MIPKTLAEVAELAGQGESFDLSLRNFLDAFYADPAAEALATEPMRLADKVPQLGGVEDAYLALLESPAPFRSRNLFVSENALSRA